MADNFKEPSLSEIIIQAREKCNTLDADQYLDFDGKTLTLCKNQKPVKSWGAISGKPDYQYKRMQSIADKGPLPEGKYLAKQENLQHFSDLPFWNKVVSMIPRLNIGGFPSGGTATWGNHRVWLTPNSNNQMYGRTNFLYMVVGYLVLQAVLI